MLNWRSLLVVVVLSLISGLAGSWIGVWQVRQVIIPRSVLRGAVQEIAQGTLSLSPEQQDAIARIESSYQQRLRANRNQIENHNREIARALFKEQTEGPEVSTALDSLQSVLRNQEREAVLYVLAVRKVLNPSQRAAFDKKVAEAWQLTSP